jgi:hypothetical protein
MLKSRWNGRLFAQSDGGVVCLRLRGFQSVLQSKWGVPRIDGKHSSVPWPVGLW